MDYPIKVTIIIVVINILLLIPFFIIIIYKLGLNNSSSVSKDEHDELCERFYQEGYRVGYSTAMDDAKRSIHKVVLEELKKQKQTIQFNKVELKILRSLCHPDKHSVMKNKALELSKKINTLLG